MAAETLNGTLREIFIVPVLGGTDARRLSMAVALIVISSITFASIRWIGPADNYQLILLGAIWSAMTVFFEFAIAVATVGQPLEVFARDYDIANGGLMPFGLVFLLFSPLAAAQVSKWRSGTA